MDTGALHFSYILRDLVDKHRDAWRGKVMYVDGKDCLGGNKTEVSVTENVKIDVLLRAPDQRRVTAIANFCVWGIPGMDMILGAPVILDYSLVVLVTVPETVRRDGQSNTEADTVHHGLLQKRVVWKV